MIKFIYEELDMIDMAKVKKTNVKKDNSDDDKIGFAIGGSTMIGLGVGFFLFHMSPFYFVASLMIGIGVGLVIASFLSKK